MDSIVPLVTSTLCSFTPKALSRHHLRQQRDCMELPEQGMAGTTQTAMHTVAGSSSYTATHATLTCLQYCRKSSFPCWEK